MQKIVIAHSPDPDDIFMFWPLKTGLLKHPEFNFDWIEADTAALNEIAREGKADICAISAALYPHISDFYQPMVMGSSVARNYGPVVVSRGSPPPSQEWDVVLSPGVTTTAHSLFQILGLKARKFEFVPIVPMENVFKKMDELYEDGVAVASILIHEGRLIFENYGCSLVCDLGKKWFSETQLPLPLGLNVMKRSLPQRSKAALASFANDSMREAISRRDEFFDYWLKNRTQHLSRQELSSYLDLYANESTLCIQKDEVLGMESFYKRTKNDFVILDWIGEF